MEKLVGSYKWLRRWNLDVVIGTTLGFASKQLIDYLFWPALPGPLWVKFMLKAIPFALFLVPPLLRLILSKSGKRMGGTRGRQTV